MGGSTEDDQHYFWRVRLNNGRALRLRATQDHIEAKAQKIVDRLNAVAYEEKIDIMEWTRMDQNK